MKTQLKLIMLPLLSSFVFGACIYTSKVEGKKFTLPKSFVARKGEAAKKKVEPGRWWRAFSDANLDRLIDESFKRSLTLEQARAVLDQAKAAYKAAFGGYFPTLGVTGNASRSRTVSDFGPPIGVREMESNSFRASIGVSYEVDLWGKVRYAVKGAKNNIRASTEDLRAAYITLAAQVSEGYYLLVQLRSQLKLTTQTIENRQAHLDLVTRRYKEGLVSALDVYQAQGSLATAKERRAALQGKLKSGTYALAVLVGRYPGEIKAGALDKLPESVATVETGLPAHLIMQRPDLRAAKARMLAADAQVGAAFAAHFPSINLSASIGGNFDPTGWIYSLIAGLTAPLFSGGKIAAEVKRNEGALRQMIAVYKSLLLNAVKEVEDALVQATTQRERVKWLEERVAASDDAFKLSTDQYTQGLIGYLPVLSAEQSYFAAQTELIVARRELVSARIQMCRALGGSWMDKEIAKRGKK
jgi:NodT family efflux transporter outer membrane factor (OMF) lipoprotein